MNNEDNKMTVRMTLQSPRFLLSKGDSILSHYVKHILPFVTGIYLVVYGYRDHTLSLSCFNVMNLLKVHAKLIPGIEMVGSDQYRADQNQW